MAGYRFDEFTGQWVVVATARRGLPIDARVGEPAPHATPARACPFCPGHESETEPTVREQRDASGRWLVRVVRNRYPSVTSDASIDEPASGGQELPARGIHEVIIEARDHDLDLADFSPDHACEVLAMYRDRLRALERQPGIAAVSVFRNRGARAGSSQSHPHAQAIATAIVPTAVDQRWTRAEAYARAHRGSLLDATVRNEVQLATRVVSAGDAWVALCPFAPHRAYETWIVPRAPIASFPAVPDALLASLSTTLLDTLARVRSATRGAAYNILVHSPPPGRGQHGAGSFHLEIAPRMGGDAGFELSTGMDVIPVEPEVAAEELRSARVTPRD